MLYPSFDCEMSLLLFVVFVDTHASSFKPMLMYYAILVPVNEDFIGHPRFQQDLNKPSFGLIVVIHLFMFNLFIQIAFSINSDSTGTL